MNQWFEDMVYPLGDPIGMWITSWGPEDQARVKVYDSTGKTQPGWGEPEFMRNYKLGKFKADTHLPFAYVMRSFKGLVVDIDGKNGGIESAKLLNLPLTLAETSKSGNGYHLWYAMDDDWDDELGYAGLNDRLGLVPGVDIRVTGCVFHYPHQRWSTTPLVTAPEHLVNRIQVRQAMTVTPGAVAALVAAGDTKEIALRVAQAKDMLDRPIPQGKRNQTLFAAGAQLFLLGYPKWEDKVRETGDKLGLEDEELDKIVTNVPKYADRS